MTISERRLWGAIKGRAAGARFRRQVPIGQYIVDFASLNPRLVIEVDDKSHEWRDESARDKYIQSQGFAILRFDNEEIAKEFEEAVNTIETWVRVLRETGVPPY